MAFTKRRKQPHLFRNPAVHPTKQVKLLLAAQKKRASTDDSTPAPIVVTGKPRKKASRKSKR